MNFITTRCGQVTLTCSSLCWLKWSSWYECNPEPGSEGDELRDDGASFVDRSDVNGNWVTLPINERISSKYDSSGMPRLLRRAFRNRSSMPRPNEAASASCFFKWRSRFVCWPKQRSHKAHLNGRSLLWMFRTWRCKLLDILNDRSQYLHLYGCSPVWVRKWRVRFADLGNTLPQNLHEYRSLFLLAAVFVVLAFGVVSLLLLLLIRLLLLFTFPFTLLLLFVLLVKWLADSSWGITGNCSCLSRSKSKFVGCLGGMNGGRYENGSLAALAMASNMSGWIAAGEGNITGPDVGKCGIRMSSLKLR